MKRGKANQRRLEIIAREKKRRLISRLTWGGIILSLVAVAVFFFINSSASAEGETVLVPAGFETHLPEGNDLPEYPSDPPAGGKHYPSTFQAKFYDDRDLANLPDHPEGYLIHNLEHGYVIIWYNCNIFGADDCDRLKQQIQQVMDEFDGVKVIAFPWSSLDTPVAMTSWGRILRFENFNSSDARDFIRKNRNKAPESFTP